MRRCCRKIVFRGNVCCFQKRECFHLFLPLFFLSHGHGDGLCHDLLIAQGGFCRLPLLWRPLTLGWLCLALVRSCVVVPCSLLIPNSGKTCKYKTGETSKLDWSFLQNMVDFCQFLYLCVRGSSQVVCRVWWLIKYLWKKDWQLLKNRIFFNSRSSCVADTVPFEGPTLRERTQVFQPRHLHSFQDSAKCPQCLSVGGGRQIGSAVVGTAAGQLSAGAPPRFSHEQLTRYQHTGPHKLLIKSW